MVKFKWVTLVFVLIMFMPAAFPQQRKASSAAEKKEQIARENKKDYQKARKMTLKHRREIQTKETRKRMDEAQKRSDAYNRQNEKKWWEKIFKQKHPRR